MEANLLYLRSILTRDGDMNFPDIQTFAQLLEDYFQPANLGQDAAHQLNLLKQGKKTAEEVLTEFRLLSSLLKYGHVRKDGMDGKTDTDTEDGGVHRG